ncbi:MAG: hypothetical protein IKZ53_07550 [Selenomonadaceae bacterium]|nr:hypothetical protein [Selenomonadaceae bacterium]
MNQRGFATLEVILMVMVIGILASIAIPRFTSVTTAANTAKIQADLSTLDAAIALYYMENNDHPTKISDLTKYLQDEVKPPKGKALIKTATGTDNTITIPSTYDLSTDKTRAVLKVSNNEYTVGDFTTKKTTDTTDG